MKRAEFLLAFALTVISCHSCELGRSSNGENYPDDTPIVLREQGSFLAGRSTVDEVVKATPDDQFWFENFRMGVWPDFYETSQFPQSAEALDQFFRQMTPNTGTSADNQPVRSIVRCLYHPGRL